MRFRRRFVAAVLAIVMVAGPTAFSVASAVGGGGNTSKPAMEFSDRSETGLLAGNARPEQRIGPAAGLGDHRGRGSVLDNQGGPDAFHYVFKDNVSPDTVSYEWVELRGDSSATWMGVGFTTGFSSTHNGYSRRKLPIGFSFPFYGASYDCVRVMTNGNLQFSTQATSQNNDCAPFATITGPTIAVFWDDLELQYGGHADAIVVGYKTFGDHFIVEFDQIGFYTQACRNVPLKFEAVLYANGNIKLQYHTINVPAPCLNSQSIGIQQAGADTSAALNYVCNLTGIPPANGRAILFYRTSGIPNPVTNLAGQYVSPNMVLTWTDPTQDTDGHPITIDSVQVWLGAVGSGQLLATVPAGVQTYTEATPPTGWRTYSLRAYRNPYYGAAVSRTVMVGNPGYWSEFETDNGGWVPDPLTAGWQWGIPTYPATLVPHSGSRVWGTLLNTNYPAGACFMLTLTPNLVVSSTTANVEFWGWWETEPAHDGVNFRVSVDQGVTWTIALPVGGYGSTASATAACIASEPCWTGTTGGTWTQVIIPIGQYVGQIPIFRFIFGSDLSVEYPGFYFDDLVIWDLGQGSGIPRPPTGLSAIYGGGNVSLTWTDPNQDVSGQPITVDSIQVWLSEVSTGTRLGSVGPGVQTYTHVNAPVGMQSYSLRAYNDGLPSTPASVMVTVGNPIYVNDFNADNGGWMPSPSGGGWSWGTPTNPSAPAPHSLPNYWGTGLNSNYGDAVDHKLDLSLGMQVGDPSAEVVFWFRYGSEATYDGCNFKASVDGGTTWTVLTPFDGAYNVVALSAQNTFMGGQPAWSGRTQSAWQRAAIPVGQYLGQIPIFRFEFSSDASVSGYMGFFFDDVFISGLSLPSAITGNVRTFVTDLPVSGARVWATGWPDTAITDSAGAYHLVMDPGTYSVTFDHAQFCDTTITEVAVVAGAATDLDVALRRPQAQISTTSLAMFGWLGQITEDSFSISNNGGQCPLSFSIRDTSEWLTVTPDSSVVNPDQSVTIIVGADATLVAGDYVSAIFITYNAAGSPRILRVDATFADAVDDLNALPAAFAFHQNYPNPFNAQTWLSFDVPQQSRVRITVFDIVGREVARPVDAVYVPGRYRLPFDAGRLPSGMYLAKMTADDYARVGKMMLLK
jgi:hypothetical protein